MEAIISYILSWVRGWNVDPRAGLFLGLAYAAAFTYIFVRARRNYMALPELAECAPQPTPPDCMVVIPARNEEAVIGRAVRSLPPDSVIVIDDESEDKTAREAESAGAGVFRVPALPRGAFGKPYACAAGARAVNSKWIMFADADTWYEDGILESLIYAAEMNGLSFISVHLQMECESLAEHILTPFCQALFFAAINPRKCPEGAFDGHCILVRRDAYAFIGGHTSGLTFLVDDLKLALLAQRHRMKLGLARTSSLGHARFQEGWKGLWEGLPRISFKYTHLPSGQGFVVLFSILLSALWLPMVAFTYSGGWPLVAVGLAVLPLLLLLSWYRSPIRVLLAPFAFYFMLPILGHVLYCILAKHRVSWKGREVS